ncbi:short chain dehydrogenase [Corynebacterium sp. CNJ-954]|uniref:short chain dehydrogenase n=1 Tax=Corynebacterium sp. CNJ-954 TaxID=1904962 RepID=UPI000966EE6F|nr:short chain dehydrogenase [Corynebacterium sp. CNJ-954]OLT52451.1 short chain dehydrogenase [Corynebacterium sp. CNJ-954]
MSRVLIIGATGTIGKATVKAFKEYGDEVIAGSRHSSPAVDLNSPEDIDAFFSEIGTVNAVISTVGSAPFVATNDATPEQLIEALKGKLINQVNLVLRALPHLTDNGSMTLISGILTQHPVKNSVLASTANGGVEAFVTSAATDLPRGIRINAVSPNVVRQSWEGYGPSFPGSIPVEAAAVASAFVQSAHGVENGRVFRIW